MILAVCVRVFNWTCFAVSRLFWKLVISLPETDGSPADDDLHRCDWLKAKFSKGAVPPNPSLEGKVTLNNYMVQLLIKDLLYVIPSN